MQHRPNSAARVRVKRNDAGIWKMYMLGAAVLAGGAFWAQDALADGHVTVTHAFNEYGEIKYPADFEYLDYVNPDAPVGGEISVSTSGTFDSMNPFATLS